MRTLTPAEKLIYIGNTNEEHPRLDFRKMISDGLEQNGITRTRAAEYIGISRQNFCNYLNGRITIRVEYIEQLLWLLESNNCLVEDEVYNTLEK